MGGVHTVTLRDEDWKIIVVLLAKGKGKLDSWECFSKAPGILQDRFWQDVAPDGLAVSNGAPQSGATGVDARDQLSRSCQTKAGADQS